MEDNEKVEAGVVSFLLGGLISLCVLGVLAYGVYVSNAKPPVQALASTEAPAPLGEALAKIYFEVASAELPAESGGAIQSVVEKAQANPSLIVLISGYHDPSGDPAKNAELAKQRAFSARDALIKAGVAESRILLRKPEQIQGSADMQEARRVDLRVQ